MKALKLLFVFLFLPLAALAQDPGWQVYKSTHFFVYYKNATVIQLEALTQKAEEGYNLITDDLGFNRFNFWTWDNRARIYLFDNQEDYMRETGDPAWAAGQAQINNKQIRTFVTAKGFLENVLPHEMAHIIFREMVGFNNPGIPLWLDEGVAGFHEKKSSFAKSALAGKVLKGEFLSLSELSKFNIESLKASEKAALFYTESFSLVKYLIDTFGKDRFVYFCQNLRDKKDLVRSLVLTYSFNDLRDFEDSWKSYIIK